MTSPFPITSLPDAIKVRFEDAFDNPVFLMANPAFALMVYAPSSQCWLQSPLDAWTRCAAAVKFEGVIPTNCIYRSGSNSSTCMVALKTSPIWQRVVNDFNASTPCLQGDDKCILSNVDDDD